MKPGKKISTETIIIFVVIGLLIIIQTMVPNPTVITLLLLGSVLFLFIRKEIAERKLERELRHATAELHRTNDITRLLLGTFDLNNIIKQITDNLTREIGFDQAFIYLLDEQETGERMLRCIATRGAISTRGIDRFTFASLIEEELIAKVLRTREPQMVQDINRESTNNRGLIQLLKLDQFIVVPMEVSHRIKGLVIVGNTTVARTITSADVNSIRSVVDQAGLAIDKAQLYQKIDDLTIIDELTRCFNHRYFRKQVRTDLELAGRFGQPLSLALIDIDHFKHYNDTNGHLGGDTVLRQVGEILRNGVRRTDTVARYGGEEFALILPATEKQGAFTVLEKLRHEIENYPFPNREAQPLGKVSISVGISSFPEDGREVRELTELADKCLYVAKEAGRNQVVLYGINKGSSVVPPVAAAAVGNEPSVSSSPPDQPVPG